MTEAAGTNLPDGVGMTALGVAWVRARESDRPDRLFDDPLAARFVAASGWVPPDLDGPDPDARTQAMLVLAHSVIIRTRFLDDLLTGAWGAGARQTVILGAGLDTRAYRLDWPTGSRCFEVDLSSVLDFKDRVLGDAGATPRCERVPLACDLHGDWVSPLLSAGFARSVPTVWIAEGLVIYFTQPENDRLLTEIGSLSTVGHRLGLTFSRAGDDPALSTGARSGPAPTGQGVLNDPAAVIGMWRWEPPADLPAWLAGHGWAAEIRDRERLARGYGRSMRWAEQPDAATRTILIDAHRL